MNVEHGNLLISKRTGIGIAHFIDVHACNGYLCGTAYPCNHLNQPFVAARYPHLRRGHTYAVDINHGLYTRKLFFLQRLDEGTSTVTTLSLLLQSRRRRM